MIDSITFNGIDRCPRFGNMTLYESPWDGMFPVDRLVRWIALNKEEKCLQNSNKRGNN